MTNRFNDGCNFGWNIVNYNSDKITSHMEDNEINDIEIRLRNFKIGGKTPPKIIEEIDELEPFLNFDDLVSQLRSGRYDILIPDHLLYENFNETVTKRYKRVAQFFTFLPYLVALALTIFGVTVGNYYLIGLMPLVYVSFFLSSMLKKTFVSLILIGLGVYFLATSSLTWGAYIMTFGISCLSTIYIRHFRRVGFIRSSISSESIFCFLFYARTIVLYDTVEKELIRSA